MDTVVVSSAAAQRPTTPGGHAAFELVELAPGVTAQDVRHHSAAPVVDDPDLL